MNKKFIAEVLKLAPEFAVVNGYFYVEPVDHILCGFVCERPPSGAYIGFCHVLLCGNGSQHIFLVTFKLAAIRLCLRHNAPAAQSWLGIDLHV